LNEQLKGNRGDQNFCKKGLIVFQSFLCMVYDYGNHGGSYLALQYIQDRNLGLGIREHCYNADEPRNVLKSKNLKARSWQIFSELKVLSSASSIL